MPAGACVKVQTQGHLLELQRVGSTGNASGWDVPGGALRSGETSAGAASRVLREETGLSVLPETLTLERQETQGDGSPLFIFRLFTLRYPPITLSRAHVGFRWRAV